MPKLSPGVFLYPLGSEPPVSQNVAISLPYFLKDPSFGDGSHPTTRLCAGAVDHLCRANQPRAVLDVGTGTGILARIARARGAAIVFGTDTDPRALSSARAHSRLDPISVAISVSDGLPDSFGLRFDLMVANILEEVLRALAPRLVRALAPGGELLLSGFTRPQAPFLRVVFSNLGLDYVSEASLDEWALLRFRSPPARGLCLDTDSESDLRAFENGDGSSAGTSNGENSAAGRDWSPAIMTGR